MYSGQAEKYIGTVFAFGEKGVFAATATAFVRSITAIGGTTASGTEFAVVVPRDGVLKNLYWSAEASTLTAPGNKITVYVNGIPSLLEATWTGSIKSGNIASPVTPVTVAAGAKVSVYIQLGLGQTGKTITQFRASFELEVTDQNPNPWDLTGTVLSYTGGSVGIGTAIPAAELHVKNPVPGGIAGVFETPSGKILSGRVGATEKFSVDAGGNVYASGKVGIGTAAPTTELEVTGTVKMTGMNLSGGANGLVLTSDANGNGTWQPTGGAQSSIDGSGTVRTIPMFTGPTRLGDSPMYEDGGNIGIQTDTPTATLEVNGSIKSPMWNVTHVLDMQPGISSGQTIVSPPFVSAGGTLLIFASGSGFAPQKSSIGMALKMDGLNPVIGYARCFTNEADSHKSFTNNALVLASGVVAAGSHRIHLEPMPGTLWNTDDFFSLTVLELPF